MTTTETTTESRLATPLTNAGWSVGGPTDTLAHVAQRLTAERTAEAPPLTPDPVRVDLQFPVRQEDGTWELVSRGQIERQPSFANQRPSKLNRTKLEAGAAIDSLLLGEEAWAEMRDQDCWKALLDYCSAENPSPAATRKLADEIARALLLRAGIEARVDELPLPSHLLDHRKVS